jgi:hypothetical protein
MNGSQRYHCADGRTIREGHDTDDCVACLKANRDAWKREYETHVNVDLVGRLREMDRRIGQQRRELARLNAKCTGPRAATSASQAFDAWFMPNLERWDMRFASVVFRAGWQSARRALHLPEDTATHTTSEGESKNGSR